VAAAVEFVAVANQAQKETVRPAERSAKLKSRLPRTARIRFGVESGSAPVDEQRIDEAASALIEYEQRLQSVTARNAARNGLRKRLAYRSLRGDCVVLRQRLPERKRRVRVDQRISCFVAYRSQEPEHRGACLVMGQATKSTHRASIDQRRVEL